MHCGPVVFRLWLWFSKFEKGVFSSHFSVILIRVLCLILWELCLFIHSLIQHAPIAGLPEAKHMLTAKVSVEGGSSLSLDTSRGSVKHTEKSYNYRLR